jgi:arsenate reductase
MTDRPIPASVVDHLAGQFAGVFSRETVQEVLRDSFDQLATEARIGDLLPSLAERFARDRLRAVAIAEGKIVKDVPEVLFVCVHNAGRSQMAAALLDRHGAGRVRAQSAGSAPTDEIDPAVVEAMQEIGLDLSKEFPKPLTNEVVQASDVVVTMGCGDACSVFSGKRYLDWDLTDPAGRSLEEVRRIRDDIDRRVQELLLRLAPAPA